MTFFPSFSHSHQQPQQEFSEPLDPEFQDVSDRFQEFGQIGQQVGQAIGSGFTQFANSPFATGFRGEFGIPAREVLPSESFTPEGLERAQQQQQLAQQGSPRRKQQGVSQSSFPDQFRENFTRLQDTLNLPNVRTGIEQLGSRIRGGEFGGGAGGALRGAGSFIRAAIPFPQNIAGRVISGIGGLVSGKSRDRIARQALDRNKNLPGIFDLEIGDPAKKSARENKLPELVGQLTRRGLGDSGVMSEVISKWLLNLDNQLAGNKRSFLLQHGLKDSELNTAQSTLDESGFERFGEAFIAA